MGGFDGMRFCVWSLFYIDVMYGVFFWEDGVDRCLGWFLVVGCWDKVILLCGFWYELVGYVSDVFV